MTGDMQPIRISKLTFGGRMEGRLFVLRLNKQIDFPNQVGPLKLRRHHGWVTIGNSTKEHKNAWKEEKG